MNNPKRWAYAFLAVMLCAVVVSVGAQQKVPAPKKTTYRFATWNPPEMQIYDQLAAKAFQRDFPGVKVEIEVTPFAQYPQKMLLDIAAGTAPDVFQLSYGWTGGFVKQNVLVDFKPILNRISLPKGVHPLSDYSKPVIDALTYSGQMVGIPMEISAPVIVYNKKLFKAAGIPFPTLDWSWADLKSTAQKLTIPGKQWGLYCYTNPNYHMPLIEGNGGSYVGADGHAVGYLNGPKVLEASKYLMDFILQSFAPTPGTIASMGGSAIPLLFTGKLAMVLNAGVWILDTAKGQGLDVENTLGTVLPPKPRSVTLGVHAYSVATSEQDKDASVLLAMYFGGANEVIDQALSSYKAIPILSGQQQQVAKLPALKAHYDSWSESVGRNLTMDPSLNGVVWALVYQKAFESVLAGQATMEAAFLKAAQDYDQQVFAK